MAGTRGGGADRRWPARAVHRMKLGRLSERPWRLAGLERRPHGTRVGRIIGGKKLPAWQRAKCGELIGWGGTPRRARTALSQMRRFDFASSFLQIRAVVFSSFFWFQVFSVSDGSLPIAA